MVPVQEADDSRLFEHLNILRLFQDKYDTSPSSMSYISFKGSFGSAPRLKRHLVRGYLQAYHR